MGHTANFNAGVEAVKVLDAQIARVIKAADNPDTLLFITADHGNIEEMINEQTGEPESSHDPSPVPFYLVAEEYRGRKFVNGERLTLETLGSLADVAPTILALMGIQKPQDMTGNSLLDGLI
jgi:2,3-bisphosphoglycerate-independent phosphoglycerate mutase